MAHPPGSAKPLFAEIMISAEPKKGGGFDFVYKSKNQGVVVDADGNIDLSKGKANRRVVVIEFTLAESVPAGLQFNKPGRDAIALVDMRRLGPDDVPTSPYNPLETLPSDIQLSGDPEKDAATIAAFDALQAKNVDANALAATSAQGALKGEDVAIGRPKREFYGFETTKDGRSLLLTDQNDDALKYQYKLKFTYNGKELVDDPVIGNGDEW